MSNQMNQNHIALMNEIESLSKRYLAVCRLTQYPSVYYTNWVDRMWEEKTFQGLTPECEPIPERLIAPSGLWINTDDPLAQLLGWAIEEGWESECQA